MLLRFKTIFFLMIIFPAACLIFCTNHHNIMLVQNGQSNYQIVISRSANEIERKAATELQKYIGEISGKLLPIVPDSTRENEFEILIGKSNRIQKLLPEFDLSSLEDDGFAIKTEDNKLIILGGKRKGTLYGVYAFLEDYLGCRKFSSKVSYLPKSTSIIIHGIDDVQVPFIKHRETHFPDPINDQDYADWHKLNSRSDRNEQWGFWVHTFQKLIPPEKYFKNHPEYFSLLGGKRIPNGQLCLTNPEVFPILVDALKKYVHEKPGANYWSVSQNDNYNECQCENCQQ